MEYPKVHLLSKTLKDLGPLEYVSLDYNEDYYGAGSKCRLVVPLDDSGMKIREGMYLHLPSKYRSRTAIIEGFNYIEGTNNLIDVTAYPAKSIAKRRINLRSSDDSVALANFGYDSVPQCTVDIPSPKPVPAETVLKTYVSRHIVNPSDAKRKMQYVSLASDHGRGNAMLWMANHGDVLADTLEDVARYAEVGFHVYFDGEKLLFDILQGKDRTRRSDRPVVFSLLAGTAIENTYSFSNEELKNVVYVEGETPTSGLSSMLAVADGNIPEGMDRRETFMTASSGAYIESDTTMSYYQIGVQHLSQHKTSETVSSNVVSVGNKEFLRDWDIGDIVSVESSRFDYYADVRITGVKESYASGKISIVPIFGENPRVEKRLKRTIKNIRRY